MAISIEIDHVTRSYGSTRAVDGLSLEIKSGEFFTLLGSSGSGKSTLLKLIGGFDRPSSGHIRFDGQNVDGVPANKRPVNTVFQGLGLFPHMTVAQNIGYGLKLRGLAGGEIASRVNSMLDMVELGGFGERDVNVLSGGQRQRVALARALVMEPGILLLDEPLTGLDERLRQQMRDEFGRLHKRTGATFVLVTHNQDEALSLSDRMAIMHHGRIEQLDRPEQFFQSPANGFVARFIGLENQLRPDTIEQHGDVLTARIAGQSLPVRATGSHDAATSLVIVRADRIALCHDTPSGHGHLTLKVVATTFRGLYREVKLAFDDGQTLVMTLDAGEPALVIGQSVDIELKPDAALLTVTGGVR